MNKTFFSSDHHFCHRNILNYQENRGQLFSTIEEHDEELIKRWNSVITDKDQVWYLGDFVFGNLEKMNYILWRLNGHIHLCLGNHDKKEQLYKTNRFSSIQDVKSITVGNQRIFMSHYAHRVWAKSHRGVYHLYGHSHNSLPDDPNSLSFDIGVDCHNFYPIEFKQVKEIMDKKTFKPVDHHRERNTDE